MTLMSLEINCIFTNLKSLFETMVFLIIQYFLVIVKSQHQACGIHHSCHTDTLLVLIYGSSSNFNSENRTTDTIR